MREKTEDRLFGLAMFFVVLALIGWPIIVGVLL